MRTIEAAVIVLATGLAAAPVAGAGAGASPAVRAGSTWLAGLPAAAPSAVGAPAARAPAATVRAPAAAVRAPAAAVRAPAARRAGAAEAGFDAARLARVDSVIERAVAEGVSPGAALVVGRYGRIVRLRGYGRTDWHPFAPHVSDSTLYDLASLTKALGTGLIATQLVREELLELDRPVHRYLSGWPAAGAHGLITVRQLLAHSSGLPPGTDLWRGRMTRAERIASLAELRVRVAPGTRREYSDNGMILLAAVLEEVTGRRLDALFDERVSRPLGLRETTFNPLLPHDERTAFTLTRIAPTEFDALLRRNQVHGVVHDLNAWALDGVAGHAGLFSSARDLAVMGQAVLDAASGRDSPLFPSGAFLAWLHRERAFDRPLGWDVPTGVNSAAGRYFTSASIGHTGFTGTSIWVDPERDLFVVLLTNRVNPTARNQGHVQLRRDVHDLVQLAIADMLVVRRE
jgi:CubicO group peptidase (beta-lactamase class C family)